MTLFDLKKLQLSEEEKEDIKHVIDTFSEYLSRVNSEIKEEVSSKIANRNNETKDTFKEIEELEDDIDTLALKIEYRELKDKVNELTVANNELTLVNKRLNDKYNKLLNIVGSFVEDLNSL